MKLAFSTLGCPTWSFDKIINEAVNNGYDGIELRGIADVIYLPDAIPLKKDNINETLNVLENNNLVITDLGTGITFHDPQKYTKSIQEGIDYIDLAHSLGVKYIRIFGDKIPNKKEKEETINLISKGINSLCEYANDKNVTCLLETHGDIVTIENIEQVIKGIHYDNFGLIWDIGHTFKVYGEEIDDFLDHMWPYIKHIHIKDLCFTEGQYKLTMLGDGILPISSIIDKLKQRNYNGYLSLEWEKRWHDYLEEPEVVIPFYSEYIRKML